MTQEPTASTAHRSTAGPAPAAVPWERLEHHYGTAEDVPALLLAALYARWRAEPEERVRIRLVEAAGQLLRHVPGEWPAEVVDWLGGLPGHPDAAQSLAGVLALRRCGLGGHDTRQVDGAIAHLSSGDRRARAALWREDEPWKLIRRTSEVFGEDRDGRTRLIAGLLERDADAVQAAAEVVARRRSPLAVLLAPVARRLSDPCAQTRRMAAAVLASAGARSAPWADELAAACADEDPPVGPNALHALVRIGDPRAVELVAERLERPSHRLAAAVRHDHWWYRPSLSDVLGPLHARADRLLPLLRARLRTSPNPYEPAALLGVLAGWGHAARDAEPEIVALLGTSARAQALDALLALDTAGAREVALPVARAAAERGEHGAAYRLWRLTGDPATAPDDPATTAALGPAAAGREPALRSRWERGRFGWERVEVAYALWRITGDPADAEQTARAARIALGEDPRIGGHALRCLRLLPALGAAAAPAVPALHPLLSTDLRPVLSAGWAAIPDDDALCATVREVLAAAGAADRWASGAGAA
ncbi:HEAT repeat domain-containing protein [Streptomyces sp. NPDC001568]|uniref:HEAT repeat domain-containing protein n=1 Tax=Streptomyces sp. NPDC001568 TaxID=3364588 RepID=UPI00368C2EB1